jgi:tetratricopeptide (TPR) repeat protein
MRRLQNNIASAIVNKVQAGIAPFEVGKLAPPHRVDPRAYDAYTRGRGYWSRNKLLVHKEDDLGKSAEEFRLAIQYDPNYAPAYAGLANYYGLAAGTAVIVPKDGWKLCEDSAQKALALDPSSAEAHLALATKLMYYDWDWAGAERELQISAASDPRYPEVHNLLSHFYAYRGRFDESVAEARRAEALDPVGQSAALQRAYMFSRRFDLFLAEVERTFSEDPARIHESKAIVSRARKQYAQEVKEGDQALRLQGRSAEANQYARGYARGGYRGWLEAKLAEMKKDAGNGYIDNLEFASSYAALDNAPHLFIGSITAQPGVRPVTLRPALSGLDPAHRASATIANDAVARRDAHTRPREPLAASNRAGVCCVILFGVRVQRRCPDRKRANRRGDCRPFGRSPVQRRGGN